MLVVGVDENGLGPRLGPLVVTALSMNVDAYDARRLGKAGRKIGIHDSKETTGFGKMAHAEGVVLALCERLAGELPRDADHLLSLLSLEGLVELQTLCPEGSARRQCWGDPLPLPAFGGDPAAGRRALARLDRRGVGLLRVRSAIACAGVFNHEIDRGRSKLVVNLARFERLLLDAREALGAELQAYCGMVGGIRHYGDYWSHFLLAAPLREESHVASYRVAGVGEVVFEVDADATHLPVALASMVGKYVREVAVERMNRFYRGHDDSLPHASGYHDPVTGRFVDGTRRIRRRLKLADRCFERVR